MNLSELTENSVVVLDSNIFIYADQLKSKECINLITRIVERELHGVLLAHVLAEVMHVFMIQEAQAKGEMRIASPAKYLSSKPGFVKGLYEYSEKAAKILKFGLQFENSIIQDFLSLPFLQRQYGLLTNDALIVAATQRLGITAIASADKCFSGIYGIQHYMPGDLT